MSVAIIAAQSENQVIGRGTEIPWKVKGEQKLFKKITMGGTLVMGRKTFDAIGRPLPGRITIVISRDTLFERQGCEVAGSLDAALDRAQGLGRPVFIAGGGEIYRQSIARADALHLTTIHTRVDGDVFFPDVPPAFRLVREQRYSSNIDYTYRYLERTGADT